MAATPQNRLSFKKTEQLQGYEIWYQDEVHFYRSSTICRMWSKRGEQPFVRSAPTQEKIAFSGFVNPTTGILYTNECEKFNFETTMQSVRLFLKEHNSDMKQLIILDNASWHKKAVRLMREDKSFCNVEFLFLPPYSPELNPIERVWRITRKEKTHNRFFEKLEVLHSTLILYFERFNTPNSKLQTLCL
ncbi:MAG: IS630 family transposase [Clostridia bacterium]